MLIRLGKYRVQTDNVKYYWHDETSDKIIISFMDGSFLYINADESGPGKFMTKLDTKILPVDERPS